MKECKIVCEGKEIGTLECTENGFNVSFSKEGKEMCNKDKCCN